MSTIKENIANNIAELRKMNHMTQQDLAEKLNYTDKAISKWERGESTPDIESLSALAKMFNLTVDDLLNETFDKEQTLRKEKIRLSKSISKIALGVLTIWLIGTVVFVYNVIRNNIPNGLWMSFIWPIPASSLLVAIVAFLRKYKMVISIAASITLWTGLMAIFLQILVMGGNIWIIFLVGVPLQAIIIITYWINSEGK
ncbi:MAG: helix-turn-helix transcriptional regulator [Bacilli bacterium]|nr:helix-turn-helix transcriptional regulator [Bacilli bacterium]